MRDSVHRRVFNIALAKFQRNFYEFRRLWHLLRFYNRNFSYWLDLSPGFSFFNQSQTESHHKVVQELENSQNRKSSEQPQGAADVRKKMNSRKLSLLDRWIELVLLKLYIYYRAEHITIRLYTEMIFRASLLWLAAFAHFHQYFRYYIHQYL